jgi:hypothetical protein
MDEEMFNKWKMDSKWFFDWINDSKEALDEEIRDTASGILACPKEQIDERRLHAAGLAGAISSLEHVFEVRREEIFDE